jgi:hypothetical protein
MAPVYSRLFSNNHIKHISILLYVGFQLFYFITSLTLCSKKQDYIISFYIIAGLLKGLTKLYHMFLRSLCIIKLCHG